MDTVGRSTLKLTAINLSDDWRDRDLIVTYDYAFTEAFRKPIAIFTALLGAFAVVWLINSVDTSIGKKR